MSFEALAVGSLGGGTGGSKVVVGSLSGLLRVYAPSGRGFNPSDLVVEYDVGAPILSLSLGRFLRGKSSVALAVLTPRRVGVYVLRVEGEVGALEEAYGHALDRPAATMAAGPFGGARDADSLVVLSMDGQLVFFDQDALSFAAFLPRFFVPGPLLYLARSDTLVVGTAEYSLEAYPYAAFATSAASASHVVDGPGEGDSAGSGRRLVPAWSLSLGQPAVQLAQARFTPGLDPSAVDILVLGTSSLFCVSSRGELRHERRLSMAPLVMAPYVVKAEDGVETHNVLVASASGSVSVFSGDAVLWSAKLDEPAVGMAVATFGGLQGLIVSLSAQGKLSLSYLGTDHSTTVIPGANIARQADFAAMEREMRKLNTVVGKSSVALAASGAAPTAGSSSSSPSGTATTAAAAAILPSVVVQASWESQAGSGRGSGKGTLRVAVGSGKKTARNVKVTLTVPSSFQVSESEWELGELRASHAEGRKVTFGIHVVEEGTIPASLVADVVVSYTIGKRNEPRQSVSQIRVPLFLIGRAVVPLQASEHKVTVSTPGLGPFPVSALFPDLFEVSDTLEAPEPGSDTSHVITFQLWGSGHSSALPSDASFVTLLVSSKDGKYRLVSNVLSLLGLVLEALPERLAQASSSGGRVEIVFSGKLPLSDVYRVLGSRWESVVRLRQARTELASASEQLRSIQKRLLSRFTARNPEPLNELDVLFESGYNQILDLADTVEGIGREIRTRSAEATRVMRLFVLLLVYKFRLDAAQASLLRSILIPPPGDYEDGVGLEDQVDWESTLAASLRHLVSTSLATSLAQAQVGVNSLGVVGGMEEVEGMIRMLVERLGEGVVLVA